MKWNHWIIVVVVLLLMALGRMAGFNTTIGQQQEQLAEKERDVAVLEAQVAALEEQLQPKPYHLPLEQVWVSSGCGYRMDPMGGGTEGLHKGVDLAGPIGTPVRAVLAGVVVDHWLVPGWHYGKEYHGHPVFGGLVVIDHGDGLFTLYGHLSATCVHEDWHIEAGQVIGELGNTGISTGPHLHFEVVVDPLRYLEER